MTITPFFSINTIDKNDKVCYTWIKLENKIKNLTNYKNKNKKEKINMSFELYEEETNYNSEKNNPVFRKLGHAALFSKNAKL